MTILIIGALLLLGIAYVDFYRAEKSIALNAVETVTAQTAAEGGIQDAIYHLKRDPVWTAGFPDVLLPHSRASYLMTFDSSRNVTPYSTNNAQGATTVKGFGGRDVPAGMVHLISIGKSNGVTHKEESMLALESVFSRGVTTQVTIDIVGNTLIDSFDSSLGNYEKTRQNSGGDLRTNSSSDDAVDLHGNVTVYGTITVGPGGTSSTGINTSGGASYIEPGRVAAYEIPMPLFPPPAGQNNGKLDAEGGVITLSAGVYVYDSIDLTRQARVEVSGQVTIYVLGDISITGGSTVNSNTKDSRLVTIIGGARTNDVKIAGLGSESQGLYFGLYVPEADVKISGNQNAAIYGSIVSNSLALNGGGAIHYDKVLRESALKALQMRSRW